MRISDYSASLCHVSKVHDVNLILSPEGEDSPVVDFGGIKLRNSPAYNSERTNIRRFISTPLTGPNLWRLDSEQPCFCFAHKAVLCFVCMCVKLLQRQILQSGYQASGVTTKRPDATQHGPGACNLSLVAVRVEYRQEII